MRFALALGSQALQQLSDQYEEEIYRKIEMERQVVVVGGDGARPEKGGTL